MCAHVQEKTADKETDTITVCFLCLLCQLKKKTLSFYVNIGIEKMETAVNFCIVYAGESREGRREAYIGSREVSASI